MIKVKFFMKSSNIIEFECEKIELTRNGYGTLTGYSVHHGESKKRLMDANVSEIEGIAIEEPGSNKEQDIDCLAMAIVNNTNETNEVSVDIRQKNNDKCFDYAVDKIREYFNI